MTERKNMMTPAEAIATRLSLRETLIGNRNFYRQALTVVLPIVLQNTLTNVVSLLDNVMVGRLGTLAMSSVAISNQLFFVFYLCIWGALSGPGIYGAQFYGKGDMDGMRHTLRFKHLLVGGIVFIAIVLLFVKGGDLATFFIATDTAPADRAETMRYIEQYIRIMLIGFVPFGLSQCYAGSLREAGETKWPMIAGMTAILVNLIFNALLIFGLLGFPRLGVVGAAIATVISRFVEVGMIVIYAQRRKDKFRFLQGLYRTMRIPPSLMAGMAQKTLPLFLNELLWSLGQTFLLQAYSMRGLEVVAAINIANTITMLFMEVCLSIGISTSILIGQRLGAERYLEARKTFWRMAFLSVSICIFLGLVLFVSAPFVPHIYNVEPEIRQLATNFIRVVAVLIPVNAFTNVCYFTMRAGGRALITFLFDCAFTWAIVVSTAFVLTRFTPLAVLPIYAVVRGTEAIKAGVGFLIVKSGVWIRNIVSDMDLAGT